MSQDNDQLPPIMSQDNDQMSKKPAAFQADSPSTMIQYGSSSLQQLQPQFLPSHEHSDALTKTFLIAADQVLFDLPYAQFGLFGWMFGSTESPPPQPMLTMAQPQLAVAQPQSFSFIVDIVNTADLEWCSHEELVRIAENMQNVPLPSIGSSEISRQSFRAPIAMPPLEQPALQEALTNRRSSKRTNEGQRKSSTALALAGPILEEEEKQRKKKINYPNINWVVRD